MKTISVMEKASLTAAVAVAVALVSYMWVCGFGGHWTAVNIALKNGLATFLMTECAIYAATRNLLGSKTGGTLTAALLLSFAVLLLPDAAHAITAPVAGDDGYDSWNRLISFRNSGWGKTIFGLALVWELIEMRKHPVGGLVAIIITSAIYNFDKILTSSLVGFLA